MTAVWEPLGGQLGSGPAACSWGVGRLDVFARGQDDALWHKWYDNGWSEWESLGGRLTSDPCAVSWGPGRIDVFARGDDQALAHRWYANGWQDWESLPGALGSGPEACSWGAGRIDIFALSADGQCQHRFYESQWSEWDALGGHLTSDPTAAAWALGRIDVFGRGDDNALWHKWFDSGWSEWESLGGVLGSGPAACSWGAGRLDVFMVGSDTSCWHKSFEGGWSEWESLGASFNADLSTVSWGKDRIDVFGRAPDSSLTHAWYDQGWPWQAPSAATAAPAVRLLSASARALGADAAPTAVRAADAPAPSGVAQARPIQLVNTSFRLQTLRIINWPTITLPRFAADEAAKLEADPGQRIVDKDGKPWRTLAGWLSLPDEPAGDPAGNPDAATIVCRRTALTITLSARGKDQGSLLPLSAAASAAIVYTPQGGGGDKRIELGAQVDDEKVTLGKAFGSDANAYGEAVAALSEKAAGPRLVISATHHYLIAGTATPPPPPPPHEGPGRWPPIRPFHEIFETPVRLNQAALLRAADLQPHAVADQSIVANHAFTGALSLSPVALNRAAVSETLFRGDWRRIIIDPPPDRGTADSDATFTSAVSLHVYRSRQDDSTASSAFPDLPRAQHKGWDQVPRTTGKPLYFRDSAQPDTFFYVPTQYKLGFFGDVDQGDETNLPPISVKTFLDTQNAYRVRATLVALPFISDADRKTLSDYLRDQVLQGTLPNVRLQPAGGLTAEFLEHFTAQQLPEMIKFIAGDVRPDQRLVLTFEMDDLQYPIFCELLRARIVGSVTLKSEGLQSTVDVELSLDHDHLISNGVALDAANLVSSAEPDGAPPPGGNGGQTPATPPKPTLTVRNLLPYPVKLGSLTVACIEESPLLPGIPTDAESLTLVSPQTGASLQPAGQASSTAAYELSPTRINYWNATEVVVGAVTVDGGSPQEWLDRVSREAASLQPLQQKITLQLFAPAVLTGKVQEVQIDVAASGTDKPPHRSHLPAPQPPPTGGGGLSTIELTPELDLVALAQPGAGRPTFLIEYTALYVDGTESLPQRDAIDPTQHDEQISLIGDGPGVVYRIEHNPPGGAPTTAEGLTRDAAKELIDNQLRPNHELWRIYATQPPPPPPAH